MTQEIVQRWAEINGLTFMDAAKEIDILMTFYPKEKAAATNSDQTASYQKGYIHFTTEIR